MQLKIDKVPLIEGGPAALRVEIKPVLGDGGGAGACGGVVFATTAVLPPVEFDVAGAADVFVVVRPAPLKALALSIDFEYVYWTIAVQPSRSRRRN